MPATQTKKFCELYDQQYQLLVLCFRNYKELWVKYSQTTEQHEWFDCDIYKFAQYHYDLLTFFEAQRQQHLIYYEDMIKSFHFLPELLDKMQYPLTSTVSEFVEQEQFHRAKAFTHSLHTTAISSGELFYTADIPKSQLVDVDRIFHDTNPHLYNKYLARYREQ